MMLPNYHLVVEKFAIGLFGFSIDHSDVTLSSNQVCEIVNIRP